MSVSNFGTRSSDNGFISLRQCSDGQFVVGRQGVESIIATGDQKVEFVTFSDHTIAYVKSSLGYPAYYPVWPVRIDKPVQAVLMDLDGTSVRSEDFWIWIIQQTTASLLDNPTFELSDTDLPFISGHSVSEHLQYCIETYCPEQSLEQARTYYFEHTHREMQAIVAGKGRTDAFVPTLGLKDFLLELKGHNIKIGLVTSGLHEKAYPEILSAFRSLGMGDPAEFYDSIITAGFPLRQGSAGTLGELSPKPHPWLYAESSRVGLGIPFEQRHTVIGIEDSGAGICSLRLAGFAAFGLHGGNIVESGTQGLCYEYLQSLEEVLQHII